jgi:thiamine-monophosphate kinase
MNGEFELIEWIRARSRGSGAVPVGIGDDAAVVRAGRGGLLVTTDLLMEGTHFDLRVATAREVGRKSLAVNLSDVAAMAGQPLAAFVSIALPRAGGRALAEELYAGMWPLAEEFGVVIAGGDTNSWDGPLVVNVCVVGEPTGSGPVTRTGAQPGDWLLVTGPLGGSLAGRHLHFTPRVREAQALHGTARLHALIDISDGVASDVRHLLRGDELGCVIDAVAVPIHPDVDRELAADERLRRALCDGEDFELLLAVAPGDGAGLLHNPPPDIQLWRIGEITGDGQRLLRAGDGSVQPLISGGWEHRVS